MPKGGEPLSSTLLKTPTESLPILSLMVEKVFTLALFLSCDELLCVFGLYMRGVHSLILHHRLRSVS